MKGHAMDIPDECSLIAAARAGDESAFGRLASRHRLELELFCLLMLGCPDRAHEAVCETVLRGWRELDRTAPSTSARVWLYRLAPHPCPEDLRRAGEACGPPPVYRGGN